MNPSTTKYFLPRLFLLGLVLLSFSPLLFSQGQANFGPSNKLWVPVDLNMKDLQPGSKIVVNLTNASMPVACSGGGNQSIGGFTQCADESNATIKTDRNDYFNCCAPASWQPSEGYEYNFPPIEADYPCVAGVPVNELTLTITINSVTIDPGSPYACCLDYLEGIYGNLYDNCPPGSDCTVSGDGIVNNGNPGIGDCAPNGDNLNYDPASSSFPLGIPYTSTTTCLNTIIATGDNLGVDIVPSFRYDLADLAGCSCPPDLISQGLISIDYDIEVEYVFCSNDLPPNCFASTFDPVGPLCETDPAVNLPTVSNNGFSGSWNPPSIDPAGQGGNTIVAVFTADPGQCGGGTVELEVEVQASTVPAFTQIGPLCENDPPVALPATSTNGITGSWDVGANFDPAGQGGNTVTINFTPDAGQCAATQTMDIEVNAEVTPAFTQIGPLCDTDPPVPLPTTSTNSITGTWDAGANFDPAGQGGTTVTITFTPDAGQCAVTQTMDIEVITEVTPAFTQIGPLCETDPPVPLPTTSTNSITGTWDVGANFDPAGQGGNTVTINFTPDAGQCAVPQTMDIEVDEEVVPTFTQIGPLCENEPPVVLPTQSNNGISGSWDVGVSFDPAGLGSNLITIVFTPDPGQCAVTANMDINVLEETIPSFSPIGPLCESDPPAGLPVTSLNGINGSWDVGPAFDPQGLGGTVQTIVFTPTPGQCASNITMDITVIEELTPVFDPIGPFCEDDPVFTLPSSSTNGLTGSWDIGTVFDPNGMGGSSTNITFIPNPNQCAENLTLTVVVYELPVITLSDVSCNPGLLDYNITLQTDGDDVSVTAGTVVNNGNGNYTIETIPEGTDVTITVLNTSTGCTDEITVTSPNCDCPTVDPPTGMNVEICENEAIPPLSVTVPAGLEVDWYDAPSGGMLLLENSTTYTPGSAGTYYAESVEPATDCTSTSRTGITLTILPLDTTFVQETTCLANETGVDTTLFNTATCDSVVITTTTLLPGTETFLSATSCDPNNTGVDTLVLTGQNGCDSLVITNTVLAAADTTFAQATTCDVNLVGVDTTLYNTATCDSVVITTTTLLPPDLEFQDAQTCNPAEVGLDTVVWTNQNGCDSLVITNTTLLPAEETFLNATSCNPMEVGTDTLTLTAQNGCDSLVITNTTLLPAEETFLNATSCDPMEVGTDTLTLMTPSGCDSLVITTTVLSAADTTFAQATTCDPMQVGLDTTVYTTPTCDSIVITTTSLLPPDISFQTNTTCDSNQVGIDTLILSNQDGCDSLVITTFTLITIPPTLLQATTCDINLAGIDTTTYATTTCDSLVITNTVYLPGGQSLQNATSCDPNEVGIDTLVLTGPNGCDSLVITNITLSPADTTFQQETTCDPMMVGVDTVLYNTPTCDSIVITATSLLPTDETFLNESSCDPLEVGVDTSYLTNQFGCDSLIITNTALLPTDTTYLQGTTCEASQAGVQVDVFATATCDSVVITTVTFTPGDETFLSATTCFLDEVGIDTLILLNQDGCDSLVVTTTSLEGEITAIESNLVNPDCNGMPGSYEVISIEGGTAPYQYSIDGGATFTANPIFIGLLEGNYQLVIQDASGCEFAENFVIQSPPQLEVFFDPDVLTLDIGTSFSLNPIVTAPDSSLTFIEWLPNDYLDCTDCLNPVTTPLQNINYTISVVDNNDCQATASISIVVNNRVKVYIPNVFSPNGDGINDQITVFGDPGLILNIDEFLIFDRWGNKVFENFNFPPNSLNDGWDGTVNGDKMTQGVMVYFTRVTTINGETILLKGEITLIR